MHLPMLTVGRFGFLLAYRQHEFLGLARGREREDLDLGISVVIAVRCEAIADRIVGDEGRLGALNERGLAYVFAYRRFVQEPRCQPAGYLRIFEEIAIAIECGTASSNSSSVSAILFLVRESDRDLPREQTS